MDHSNLSSSTYIRVFLKMLPPIAIAAMAAIAINHPPSSETNRAMLGRFVVMCILFIGWYGPRPTELFACRTRPTS